MVRAKGDKSGQRLENVQFMRGLAALLVVIGHSLDDLRLLYHRPIAPHLIPGQFGVEIFFVISGYIITLTSFDRFQSDGATARFLWHRFWRVVPLYWLVTFAYLIVAVHASSLLHRPTNNFWSLIVASLLFFPVPNGLGRMSPIFAGGWSLNFETFFYVIFAILLPFRRLPALIAVTAGFILLASIHPLVSDATALGFWSTPFILEFVFGIWIAMVARRVTARAPSLYFWPITILLLVSSAIFWSARGGAYHLTIIGMILATLLGVAAVFCQQPARLSQPERVMAAIGDSSYSLYLTHIFTVRAMTVGMRKLRFAEHVPAAVAWMIVVAASVGLAYLIHRLVEKPAVSLGGYLYDRQRRTPTRSRLGTSDLVD